MDVRKEKDRWPNTIDRGRECPQSNTSGASPFIGAPLGSVEVLLNLPAILVPGEPSSDLVDVWSDAPNLPSIFLIPLFYFHLLVLM